MDMIDAAGDGDATRRDDREHGHRERRQALRRYLIGQQQLARELAQREQADGRQQAGPAGPRAYPHTFSIGASAGDSSCPVQRASWGGTERWRAARLIGGSRDDFHEGFRCCEDLMVR